jgi:hypothetical protein
MIRYFDKTIDFMKVMISKIIYDDKIFNKSYDNNIFYFMKVMMSEIFLEFMIFNKTIDFMKVMTSEIIYDDTIF